MNLLFGLIASSIVGSVIFLTLLVLRPITGRLFSKAWHYYCLIVPVVFLLGGTYIATNLTGLMPDITPAYISPAFTSQEISTSASQTVVMTPAIDEFTSTLSHEMSTSASQTVVMTPAIDEFTSTLIHGSEADVGLAAVTLFVRQLMTYLESAMPFLIMIWLLGAIMFITTGTRRYLQYRRMVLHNAKRATNIDCKIPVVISAVANSPMIMGVIKPIIVLPKMPFTDEELDMILAHEIIHYRCKDLLIKLVMTIANAVHWFNPAVYVLNRQLRTMCELSCDEKLVSDMDTQNRVFYGETVLRVLEHSTSQKTLVGNVAFATNLCNSKKNIKRRLISMMNTKKMRKSVLALALVTVLLVVGSGFAIASMVDSAMPDVYDIDTTQNDIPAYEDVNTDYNSDASEENDIADEDDEQENTTTDEYTDSSEQPSYPDEIEHYYYDAELTEHDTVTHPGYVVITCQERNIEFLMRNIIIEGNMLPEAHHFLSLETTAIMAADAIYTEFGVCIDGLRGHMIFFGASNSNFSEWSGFILSEELTTHSLGDEAFHFIIDAVTGEVLHLTMNTVETPFLG